MSYCAIIVQLRSQWNGPLGNSWQLPGNYNLTWLSLFALWAAAGSSLSLQWLQRRSRNQTSLFDGVSAASDRISIKKGKHVFAIRISLLEFFIFVLKPILYFPIPTFSILFQPIFHNFTIFWVSEDHSQLFSILCLGESQRLASLASFKATVHCQWV